MLSKTVEKIKILFADDDEDLVMLVQHKLTVEGYLVRTCLNGKGLIELALRERPDLILLDVSMDGVHGPDLCRLLKKNRDTLHIPIVLFSSNDSLSIVASECGADGFIEKTFGIEHINSYIRDVLRRTRKS